jgi:glucose dehydrogenase
MTGIGSGDVPASANSAAADSERGMVYATIGNPSPDLYAEVRPGDYGWTESLVALNGDTGKLVWAISTCRTTPGTSTRYQRRFLADVMGKDGQTLMVITDVGRRRSN